MSKHTKGKWKVGFDDGTGKSYITDPEGRVVVRGGFDSLGVKHGVLKASDARLIAAAPELLEALESVPADADFGCAEDFRAALERWWSSVASPAISKATGQ